MSINDPRVKLRLPLPSSALSLLFCPLLSADSRDNVVAAVARK